MNSGAMVFWKQDLEADAKKLVELRAQQPSTEATYAELSPEELESNLVHVHRLQGTASAILNKYKRALEADDEQRKQIREDLRAMQNRSR